MNNKDILKTKKRSNPENGNLYPSSENKRIKLDEDLFLKKIKCTYFYIDKSLIIKEFLEESSDIICVTRPSGYGKTVNLNLMRLFFEMDYEKDSNNNSKKFFETLNIAKEVNLYGDKYIDLYQGKYPVVHLDFNEIILEKNFENTINNFKKFIQDIYSNYKGLKIENLIEYEKKKWEKFINFNIENNDLVDSINFLCKILYKLLNKQIILLIDNYDSPILNALNTEFFEEFFSFYKILLTNIFRKQKNYLFKSLITGKIDLNIFNEYNSKTYNININKYNEYYSVTGSELKKLLFTLNLGVEREIFEKYCNNNEIKISPPLIQSSSSNKNEINIIYSSSYSNLVKNNNNSNY